MNTNTADIQKFLNEWTEVIKASAPETTTDERVKIKDAIDLYVKDIKDSNIIFMEPLGILKETFDVVITAFPIEIYYDSYMECYYYKSINTWKPLKHAI